MTPTVIPSWTPAAGAKVITLKANGKGDYPDLPSAVQAAPDGAVIVLDKGVYKLKEAYAIEKPITLISAGIDQTIISSYTAEYLIKFKGTGPFNAQYVTFRHEGGFPGNVVIVEEGELNFQSCRFTGGIMKQGNETLTGAGLYLWEIPRGSVDHCIADANREGLYLKYASQVSLESNELTNNKNGRGIFVGPDSNGIIRGNRISKNGSGIAINGSSNPTIEENIISSNSFGIWITEKSQPTILKNIITSNQNGVWVWDEAQPIIEGNTISKSSWACIAIQSKAEVSVRKNQCTGNKVGLFLTQMTGSEKGKYVIEDNVISGSGYVGMILASDTPTIVRRNACTDNSIGIEVMRTNSLVEENDCSKNRGFGIVYEGKSNGVARRNQCNENKVGIGVDVLANPELIDNLCQNNKEAEIVDKRVPEPTPTKGAQ
jgi:parallel beta-helix repeat protein